MSTRIRIIKRSDLTTTKGCFNCVRHETGKCILSRHGKPIDVFEILTNDEGKKYRSGCCCVDYILNREKVQFT